MLGLRGHPRLGFPNAPTISNFVGALSYIVVILSLGTELGGKPTHLLGD